MQSMHSRFEFICQGRSPYNITAYSGGSDSCSDCEERDHLQDAITKGWFRQVPTEEDSPVNVKHLLLTAREIAGAMSYLHDEDILHSDLTGGNILLGTSNKDERGYTALVSFVAGGW